MALFRRAFGLWGRGIGQRLFSSDLLSLLADALLLGKCLGAVERLHEADGDDELRDEEGQETDAADAQFDRRPARAVDWSKCLAHGRHVVDLRRAEQDEEQAVAQDDARRGKEPPVHVRLHFEHEQFEHLCDGFEHKQAAQQLRDVVDDVLGMEHEDESEAGGIGHAQQKTNQMVHIKLCFNGF